ncbi:5-oxoprolinase subunit B family protein [Anaerotruncus rubiinfantis]|uniref:5-oxoprolinase subunit B family protein n=1 Tax=Anaerotruncus rubiinfantis TaxID=1720200 RepID=UPI00164DCEC9|nr:allophanate hydrolase subunit 1 [Anaerotruncus rubiinfantis]
MEPKFLFAGDKAISIEFGTTIDPEINTQVIRLHKLMQEKPIDGVVELVPSYRSLNIVFCPEKIRYDILIEKCKSLLQELKQMQADSTSNIVRMVHLPILFGGEVGDELEVVADFHGITPQELINTVTSHPSRVYMIGFMPGLAYMSGNNGLHMPRHTTPRLDNGLKSHHTGGVFVLADNQTNFMDFPSATGWHPVGYTPVKQFLIGREDPFLFRPGDWCKFEAITQQQLEEIEAEMKAGTYQVNVSYEEVE